MMLLTDAQKNALFELGESATGHDFISARVLKQLLARDIIYWREDDEIDFTPVWARIYEKLTRAAQTA